MEESSKKNYCLNCNTPFIDVAYKEREVFCSQCGQSNKGDKLSLWIILKDAFSNFFNLDGRIPHTMRDIIFPSKLTKAYVAGRRKYYVNPARLFIVTLLALITMALFTIDLGNNDLGMDKFETKVQKSKILKEYEILVDSIVDAQDMAVADSIKKHLFKGVKSMDRDTFTKNAPSLNFWGKDIPEYGILTYDALHLSPDSIFSKYNIEGFWEQLKIKKNIKLYSNPVGGIRYLIKNISWTVLITVILMSFFMYLIYIRGKYYLVEHLILIFNSHSLLFIAGFIYLLIVNYFNISYLEKEDNGGFTLNPPAWTVVFILIQFLTLKRYYQQSIIKTLVKQFAINFVYLVVFVFVFVFVSLISLLLF